MKTGRISKALYAVGAAALAAMLMLTLNPAPASAYQGGSGAGGSGGGGGGGGWGAISRWNYVNTWQELVDSTYMLSNMRNHNPGLPNKEAAADWFVSSSSGGQGLLDMCKGPNLERIYYLGASGGIPIKPNSATGTFPFSYPAGGDAVDQYAATLNGRGVYVMCVIDASERITKTEEQTRPISNATSISGVYAWNTSVTAELNGPDAVDPIGKDNLNDQSNSKKTHFGTLADSIAKSGAGDYSSKLTELQEAKTRDGSDHHGELVLNNANREGLAEGGVLSVNEHTLTATVNLSQSWSEKRTRQYTCDYVPGTNGGTLASPSNCSYGDWSSWSEVTDSRAHRLSTSTPTQQNTAFWQIVSVHCNPEELNAALAAYGVPSGDYRIMSQTRTDDKVTTLLYTSPQSDRASALNGRKIFGVASLPVTALARTGQIGFYDKHCEVQCITDPSGAGASNANGANKNVGIESNRGSGVTNGGALIGDSNANYFEVFRDNDRNRVSVNMAYPDVTGRALAYTGQAPIATTVSLWNGSTPSTRANNGGQFSMWAVNGDGARQLFTGNQSPVEQTNFTLADNRHPVQSFSGPTATKLAGPYRAFDVAGTWASEATAPVVMNIKWEYQPTTTTTVPASVGMNANRSITYGTVNREQKIDVDCYAVFGNSISAPTGFYAPRDTGSGVANVVDANILDKGMTNGANAFTNQQNLVIRFVRGVAE